jgi:integrase
MYKRVFLRGDSRNYRVRYRLSNGPRIYEVTLRTHIREVAEKILEQERELLGLGSPKPLRDAARRTTFEHLEGFIASLVQKDRSKSHVIHTRGRLVRLLRECNWKYLRDISAEKFTAWTDRQAALSVKTRNEYLAHAIAFVNWAIREGRMERNPLRSVVTKPSKGNETFLRRALTIDQLVQVVSRDRKRGLAYLVAGCTGLRRREIKLLLWSDIHLDGPKLFIEVRAVTTKAKRAAVLPVVPILADALRAAKAKGVDSTGRVFPRGLPSVGMLARDLVACGIAPENEHGRVDFHALRHTFASILANVGVSELVRVKLARHSEWRQTDRYTDPASLPLFAEMEKFASALPSSIPSPISGKSWPKTGKVVQNGHRRRRRQNHPNCLAISKLVQTVPSWESVDMVPKGGLEPPCG